MGELAQETTVQEGLGCDPTTVVGVGRPIELLLVAAIRCAKSLIGAALALQWSQICVLQQPSGAPILPGEIPRISILSYDKDKAQIILQHLLGALQTSKALKPIYLGEFKSEAVSGIRLKHPSGRPIEVAVVAGARAGGSVISRWSAGCIFDEAARMLGAEDGVVNFDDAYRAVVGRLLKNAQIVSLSSPWAPMGPIYDRVVNHWGSPTKQLVVVKAPGPAMNPYYWTPEMCEQVRLQDESAYRTDVLAEFLDPESTLFPSDTLEACIDSNSLASGAHLTATLGAAKLGLWGRDLVAAMDPATRGNAWPLVVLTKDRDGVSRVVHLEEFRGTKVDPLNPDRVLRRVADVCRAYGLDYVLTDQYSADALRAIADRYGLSLAVTPINQKNKLQMFETLRTAFAEKTIRIPAHAQLLQDLRMVRKRVTNVGPLIALPPQSDGRHCDLAFALALAMSRPLREPVEQGPALGTQEAVVAEAEHHFRTTCADSIERARGIGTEAGIIPDHTKTDGVWWEGYRNDR